MTSQTGFLTLKFYFLKFFELVTRCKKNFNIVLDGIYNSRVTKPSYKTELRIMMSQTELLTLKFYLFLIF